MRIRRLEVDNLRGLENFKLDLCDARGEPRRLTVLVGPNMSGKTTVLDALHLAYEAVGNMRAPQFRHGFDPGSPGARRDPTMPITVTVGFSLHDGERDAIERIEREALQNPATRIPEAASYSFTLTWPPSNPDFHSVKAASPAAGQLAFRGRAVAKIAKNRKLVAEGIFDELGGIIYLDQHRSVNLRGPWVRTGSEEGLREEAGSRDILPWLELQSRLDVKWDPSTQGESSWSRVKRYFKDLAAPAQIDDIKASDEGFDLRLLNGGVHYYSAGMSSGEQQILRFVTNLVSQRATRSVVLIDEIELHLHPSWQRDILHFCRRGGGDDNQFIVTTHSESVLRYVDPECVVSLGDIMPHHA